LGACRTELSGPAGSTLQLVACGDSATLVTVTGVETEVCWRCVRLLATRLGSGELPGMIGAVATYETVLAEYDPVTLTFADVVAAVGRAADPATALADIRPIRRIVVPVVYGGEFGPDLAELANELGLSPRELIRRHCGRPYVIRTVASPAGAPMTDGPELPHPPSRLAVPRVAVPGGSVAVAGRQGIVYATPSPGGWRLIGRTPLVLFDPYRDPPVPYRPGDLLEYVEIDVLEWPSHEGASPEVSAP
jgi:KipI family sensor histidine kinase inhibitor